MLLLLLLLLLDPFRTEESSSGGRETERERASVFFYDLERYERDVRRADLSLFFSLRREKEREREKRRHFSDDVAHERIYILIFPIRKVGVLSRLDENENRRRRKRRRKRRRRERSIDRSIGRSSIVRTF